MSCCRLAQGRAGWKQSRKYPSRPQASGVLRVKLCTHHQKFTEMRFLETPPSGWHLLDLCFPTVPVHFGQFQTVFITFPPIVSLLCPLPPLRPGWPLLNSFPFRSSISKQFSSLFPPFASPPCPAREGLLHCRAEAGCVMQELDCRERAQTPETPPQSITSGAWWKPRHFRWGLVFPSSPTESEPHKICGEARFHACVLC